MDKDSKEAKRAAQKSAAASTGLDAFLQQIESKKKARHPACTLRGARCILAQMTMGVLVGTVLYVPVTRRHVDLLSL